MAINPITNKAIAPTIQDVNDDMLLGYLYGSSLSQIKIQPEKLKALFEKHKLSTDFIGEIKNHDAFRRASSSMSQKRVDVMFNGVTATAKLEVDETNSDDEKIVRILGRKIVNKQDEELSYAKLARITFNREDGTISFNINKKFSSEYPYKNILLEIRKTYENNAAQHNEKTLKNIINKMISSMHPVSILENGQFKFIPKKYKTMLFNMQGMMNDLSTIADGQRLEVFPLVNTTDINAMLLKAVNNSIAKELGSIQGEIQETIDAGNKFNARSVNSYKEKFMFFKEELLVYEELLQTSMTPLGKMISKATKMIDATD